MITPTGHNPPPAGAQPWRTLEEYSADAEFLATVRREFAPGAEWWLDQPSRRGFLQRMGASFALAGLTGCVRQPKEEIVPYVQTPEHMLPGKPQFYATAMPQPGGAIGILAESHEGRPTKVEGNPDHPASRGATDSFAQASVLDLYDPHRTRVVNKRGQISSWRDFYTEVQPQLETHRGQQGAGLAILTGEILSPTLLAQLKQLLTSLPRAAWHQYESAGADDALAGTQLAFGARLTPRYRLENADVIFSVDADFLGEGPARVRLAREFISRRQVAADGKGGMSRLYVVEFSPSITGSKADHWLRLAPDEVAGVLAGVAKALGIEASGAPASPEKHARFVSVLAKDLQQAGARAVVIPGRTQSAAVQALAHAINDKLGAIGHSATFTAPLGEFAGASPKSLGDLVQSIQAGQVQTLFVFGVDAVYGAPADLKLAEALKSVPLAIHHGLHVDETAKRCLWTLPATHFFEEWSDTQAEDGTVSLIQPLIRPLYEGRSAHEVFNILLSDPQKSGYDTVRGAWLEKFGGNELTWSKALHDGLVKDSAPPLSASPKLAGGALSAIGKQWPAAAVKSGELAVVFKADPCLYDGRYATNGWLQELPQPISKLTWGNAAWIGVGTAKELGIKSGDVLRVRKGDAEVSVPAWIQPGQPDGVLTLWLGHGRAVQGTEPVGVNVAPLRTSDAMWRTAASVKPEGERIVLPQTQTHHLMEGRDLVRQGTLQQVQANPGRPAFMNVGHHGPAHEAPADHGPAHDHDHDHDHDDPHDHDHDDGHGHNDIRPPSLYPDWPMDGAQWGMSINLSACIGCNACVVACQSENNIPVVGPEQVIRGREMHWLRIDSYFDGPPEAPDVLYQPVMCQHCEHAPCEPVCPVGATTHSHEGLNEMAYNRCIGTRYCSNNCPYKVRRFNFLNFREEEQLLPVLQLHENPNVTVRSRGVMEKCTYCVQRINTARIHAKIEDRDIRDGEIVTACQAVCPTQAIVFGNIADHDSAVAKEKSHPLTYGLLADLGNRPRTSYQALVRNPHPELAAAEEGA